MKTFMLATLVGILLLGIASVGAQKAGSCSNSAGGTFCGFASPDKCYCDNACVKLGDCCKNYESVCNKAPVCGDGKCEQGEDTPICSGCPSPPPGPPPAQCGVCVTKCQEDCGPKKLALLSDYPQFFRTAKGEWLANLAIVVGEKGSASNVIAMGEIIEGLQKLVPTAPLPAGASKLANEVVDLQSLNTVVIGNPCDNSISAQLMGYPEPCTNALPDSKALVKLYTHGNGNKALLVAGKTELLTSIAARFVSNMGLANKAKTELFVCGTTLYDAHDCDDKVACSDSDGGKSPFVKGTCSCAGVSTTDGFVATDFCKATGDPYDPAVAQGKALWELYLMNGNCAGEVIQCPNGCKDGACIDSPAIDKSDIINWIQLHCTDNQYPMYQVSKATT